MSSFTRELSFYDREPGLWPAGWPHEAPDEPFTISAARHVMQIHRECDRFDCARKMSAWNTLVEARVIVPDSGRIAKL